jgi:hypothetical protein|tara:strand:+ start:6207 stop:6953 length:747 start_codon:yes stop_codon:yes gene_type:complete
MAKTNTQIVKSFKVQNELNPKIWFLDGDIYKMKPEIRKALLEVVENYKDFTDLDLDIEDITLTGSLSNFNWSDFSDVDLHIIMDFSESNELLKKYLDSRRIIWNSLRDVTVKDFDVEVYAQDIDEPHFASGVYSVLYDDWIVNPTKSEDVEIDTQKLLSKSREWMKKIDNIETDAKRKEPLVVLDTIEKLKNKLKKYRGDGLKDEGEYSYENLTFKFLRRNEYLKKINDVRNELIDKTLTVEEKVSDI